MKKHLRKIILGILLIALSITVGCTSTDVEDEESSVDSTEATSGEDFSDEFGVDEEPAAESAGSDAALEDEFAEFDSETGNQAATTDDAEASLEEELNNTEPAQPQAATEPEIEMNPAETLPEEPMAVIEETPPPPIVAEEAPAEEPAPVPVPTVEEPVVAEESTSAIPSVAEIKNIEYRANESGGTIVVEGNAPLTFTTRQNAANNQFIIEIPDSHLPDSLKRPFNTKDFNGDIGSIDAYQNANSNITRIVVQLRPGAIEPTISQEGTSLLVMTQKPTTTAETSEVASEPVSENVALEEQTQKTENEIAADQILSSRSLEAYLTNNQQFYGSPISIEMDDLELKQALKFIAEESGLNMVIDSGVGGAVSLKLRQVPWDQALVVILKSRQLGYVRQGNILRIATLADLQKEEKAVIDSTAARQTLAPLVVRLIPVSYAKVDDMEKQVKNFLTEKRGQVVADARTGSLVITDTDENIKRIEQVVKSLDIAPPQVLIEGKIVEASESFSREFGVNWGFNGRAQRVGDMGGRAINMRPSLGVNNSSTIAGRNLNAGFTLGTLDIFGDLSAALSLSENEQKVKVLSSPRIVALHNQQASIEQRTQLPITQATNVSGVVTTGVTYKDVTLNLKVTPQITADNSVIMALNVVREFASAKDPTNNFSVNSRNASTTVIVRNGQTAVIGGIYQDDSTNSEDGVPWLRKIPILGGLFAATTTTNNKAELLIFLTPRILTEHSKVQASAAPTETPLDETF